MEATSAKQQRAVSTAYALAYAQALPALQQVAREHGYALAVHGSMATDLDLLACPWTENAADPEALIEAIRECVGGHIVATPETDPKPHGRMAWNIVPRRYAEMPRLDLVPWLDISVMPRSNS